MKTKDFEKNILNNIYYIYCDDKGNFDLYGYNNDLIALYAFITYKLLKEGIDIKYLINSMCNANDLFKTLK